ncbi:hypothetical protein Bca52824_015519 [Brassica carinata]|uniref:Uncharacterized protein n=1 Tax=Brassica carinata TaxID=52824 RepID=A0A8X7W2P8_BRACI|nr:hypothetical protein Bca52824_015519 [Brassica carinata]
MSDAVAVSLAPLLVTAASPVLFLVTAHTLTASRKPRSRRLIGSARCLVSPELAIRHFVSSPVGTLERLVRKPLRLIQSNGPLGMSFHFLISGLWISLESNQSCRSRYGNIGVLSLSLDLGPILLLIIAKSLEGGLTRSSRSHLFNYMHRQSDLIPATLLSPGRVTSGRETSSPLRSCASPMQSPQEAFPSENPDSSSFIQSLSESDDWQFCDCSAKPSWFLHGNAGTRSSFLVKSQYIFNVVDLVIYSFLDSHSPSILVNAKSSQLGLCFPYGHGASHQQLLSVIIPTVAYRCINVVFDYQFALGKKMKFLHGTLYTAKLDSPLKSSIFQWFVMVSIIVLPSSMTPGSSTSFVNFVAL